MITPNRFANAAIIAAAAFAALILAYSLKTGAPNSYAGTVQIVLGVAVIGLLLALLAPAKLKLNFTVLMISAGISLLVADVVIGVASRPGPTPNIKAADRAGVYFDERSKREVIKDLRDTGIDAYPLITPGMFLPVRRELTVDGVVPLGSISDTTLVWCNESGDWQSYHSDERGFQNPSGIWDEDQIDIAFIGDSFTSGACVTSEENAPALVRQAFPNTLNLGSDGSGAVIQYAIMKEYLPELRPKVVLWMYWEGNDLFNLTEEYDALKTLRRYLEPDFSQGLASRQAAIDEGLKSIAQGELAQAAGDTLWEDLRDTFTLQNIREQIREILRPDVPCVQLPILTPEHLDTWLTNGAKLVESWGGGLYFVYLPTWARYGDPDRDCNFGNDDFKRHDQVISIAKEVGLTIIDISDAFAAHPDPTSLWPFGIDGLHYNAAGYKVVAEAVLEQIDLPAN